ncbi:alpha-L-fucosidase [Pedobacter steynii]|uniref:alpha-L-fucosidase n=1 Tax=Pedobacter steynii TaxID=430522 RepID=A0A1D7QJZ6_9SPHI|nr:alpha-L-fucosidase [Pedobacter steynii]AOM78919.1 alpha-L-fucosidase [Pedobacter steynii]
MKLRINRKSAFLLSLSLITGSAYSQVPGDEDKEMFNQARQRDERAIDVAKTGWWTESMKRHEQRMQWWREAKFGMFVHWGLYSMPEGEWKGKVVSGYAEHLMRKEKISRAAYLELAHEFNPLKFNAEEWILNAKKAGMHYFIVTAKHHDGFALFDSGVSDFDVIDQTPFKRDPMAELAAAAKKHGMKFGFYYSHAFDWEHPDAPGNDWEYQNPGGDRLIGGANWFDNHPEWLPKAVKYVDQKAIPQIKELIRKYHPDILWFDTPHKLPLSENLRILQAIRETDPDIVVNGRLARSTSGNFGDYLNTGDRPAELRTVAGDWEAIPTTNESYGYSKHDNSHKPAKFFIQLLANAASRGGNILLNIGPKGDGSFDQKDSRILDSIGSWMKTNSVAIFGTERSALPIQSWGVVTQKEQRLYLHVFEWPEDGKLVLAGLKTAVDAAYLIADESETKLNIKRLNSSDLSIDVPAVAPDGSDAVLVLELKAPVKAEGTRLLSVRNTNRLLAFDASLHGKGFGFGDGKTDRYFVDGWKSKTQSLSWDFRTPQPAEYQVLIKYLSAATAGGTYLLQLGDFKKELSVIIQKTGVVTQDIGTIKLNKGAAQLKIAPLQVPGNEPMKLLEIQLIPLTK